MRLPLESSWFVFLGVAACWTLVATPAQADEVVAPGYEEAFRDDALRVDLVHHGRRGHEAISLITVRTEPTWSGTRSHLIDPLGRGAYRFRLFDQATSREIFRYGYSSLFGEWLSTEEAAGEESHGLVEVLRFPRPRAPVFLVLEVREAKTGAFAELGRFAIDPAAYDLAEGAVAEAEVLTLHDGGRSPAETVDVLIVGDGYGHDEQVKLRADAQRFADLLLAEPPFDRWRERLAVRLIAAISRHSGPDEPRKGLFGDTAAGAGFDTFRSPRYLTTPDGSRLADLVANAPCDTVLVMVNTARYGGGGVYNAFSVFPSDNEYDEYVMLHEFGHGFAGLGDEYFDSQTSYEDDAFYPPGVEPAEPNLTLVTTREGLKWGDLVAPATPIPTPDTPEWDGVVGLFEGGGYKPRGIFRPTRNSRMFRKGLLPWGAVNERAIENAIRYHVGERLVP